MAVQLLAGVRRQAVDHAAGRQQGIIVTRSGERAHGGAHGLRLGPSALPRPLLEPLQIGLIEVDLQGSGHEQNVYIIMISMSRAS